ncbi:MAG: hypothetical protein V4524_00660 [Patescibacteria group bacterium]
MESHEHNPFIEDATQNPEQQLEADTIAKLREIVIEKMSGANLVPAHEKITAFLSIMDKKYGRDVVKQTKLFHVFTNPRKSTFDFASTKHALDLPEGEMEKFIRGEL